MSEKIEESAQLVLVLAPKLTSLFFEKLNLGEKENCINLSSNWFQLKCESYKSYKKSVLKYSTKSDEIILQNLIYRDRHFVIQWIGCHLCSTVVVDAIIVIVISAQTADGHARIEHR